VTSDNSSRALLLIVVVGACHCLAAVQSVLLRADQVIE